MRGSKNGRKPTVVVAALTTAVLLVTLLLPTAATAVSSHACETRTNNTHRKLQECVGVPGALEHLTALQAVANANGGNRAAGFPGYDASVAYVVSRLERAGYAPEVVPFSFIFFELHDSAFSQTAPPGEERDFVEFDFTTNVGDYDVMTYSPDGDVTGELVGALSNDFVTPSLTTAAGCTPEDYPLADPVVDQIALVQRGTCTFQVKAENAEARGYDAVIVFNQGIPGREGVVLGTLSEASFEVVNIPAIGVSFALGQELAETDGAAARIFVDALMEQRDAANVIAELPGRTSDNVVMMGAHLDSVPEGEGIQDNGTGSAGILELAENLARTRLQNTVRFAWWGAEEAGLVGSNLYVASLSDEEFARIALYLNYDMIGSPNFVRFVYDGNETLPTSNAPDGSAAIEDAFRAFYSSRGLAAEDTAFDGRSDYQAFILNGIPAGGLFTGAEVAKTAAQVATYGGVAGLAYDVCYHSPCDDLVEPHATANQQAVEDAYGEQVLVGNVNTLVYEQNLDALSYAALLFGQSTESVNGVPGRHVPGTPGGPNGSPS